MAELTCVLILHLETWTVFYHAINAIYGIKGCPYSWLPEEQARITDPSRRSHTMLHSMQTSQTVTETSAPPPDPTVSQRCDAMALSALGLNLWSHSVLLHPGRAASPQEAAFTQQILSVAVQQNQQRHVQRLVVD